MPTPLELVRESLRAGADLRLRVGESCADSILAAASAMTQCLRAGNKLLLFGNGGSAADAQHLAAEFTGRFLKERRALPAIALHTDTSALTAISNDYGFERAYARQVEALGRAGDVALAITTSGNSKNILAAVAACRDLGIVTIGLTSERGGAFAQTVDLPIVVPSVSTPRIQECHITIGHILCELVENALCPEVGAALVTDE
jgi:D-sedoheptulose 7-phosphate isomerase